MNLKRFSRGPFLYLTLGVLVLLIITNSVRGGDDYEPVDTSRLLSAIAAGQVDTEAEDGVKVLDREQKVQLVLEDGADIDGAQRVEAVCRLHHRPHRVGEHQRLQTAGQGIVQHGQQVRAQERLAAGEPRGADRQAVPPDLVKEGAHLGPGQKGQAVVARRAFDVAGLAGEIAQRARVDPQRVQPTHVDMRAAFPARGGQRIAELGRVERTRFGQSEGRTDRD